MVVADADREKAIQVAAATKLREIGTREAQREQAVRLAELVKEQTIGEQTAAFQRDTQVKEAEQQMRISVAEANAKAVDGEIFNLGGDRVISLKELADLVIAANGDGDYVIKTFPPERKKIDIGDYYATDDKFRQATGWRPRVPLDEALRRSIAFYREHLPRYL